MKELILFRGLPGCGKSTQARSLVSELTGQGVSAVVVERDMIRKELFGVYWTGNHADEVKVSEVSSLRIRSALSSGITVIESSTNLRDKNVRDLMRIANIAGASVRFVEMRDVTPEVCIQRDSLRDRTVGAEVITGMFERFIQGRKLEDIVYSPKPVKDVVGAVDLDAVEPYVPPYGGVKTILLDLDGTVADHHGVRSPYDTSKYREDNVHWDVVDVVRALKKDGFNIHVFSGRHKDFQEDAVWWLNEHKIPFDDITMREREGVKDVYEKLFLFEKYIRGNGDISVHSVFDDRDQVVFGTWRRALKIRCFQVETGGF